MNIKSSYTLQKEDIIESVHVRNKLMNRIVDLFFVFFSVFGLYYFVLGFQHDVTLEYWLLSIVLVLSPVFVHYLMKGLTHITGSWMYKLGLKTLTQTDYVFEDHQFTITNEYGVTTLPYEKLQKVTESNTAFYFYINRLVFFIISKKGLGMENTSVLKSHLETKLDIRQNKLNKK